LLAVPTWASPASVAIQKAYNKEADAAHWKFMAGMWSARDLDFQAYGLHGERLDHRSEVAQMTELLEEAESVKETVTIVSCRPQDANHAVCRVHDVMTFEGAKGESLVLDSLADDAWGVTPRGWKLQVSHLVSEKLTRPPH
jgi:hypothetical protein